MQNHKNAMASKTRAKKPRPFSNGGYRDEEIIPCAWDVETIGLGGELIFITTATPEGVKEYEGKEMIERLFLELIQFPYPCIWYAHNAQYDWRYILPYVRENEIPCEISLRNETDIYQIVLFIDGARIVLRDSLAVFPGTLREMLASFCPELPKLDIDFEREVFDPKNLQHRAYAKRDSEGLRVAISRLNLLLNQNFGVYLGHTTSGTALNAWQRTIPDGVYFESSVPSDQEDFIRTAYFGGIVFLTRTDKIRDCETYDVNSSYPRQMRSCGVPYGNPCCSTEFQTESPGIFRVKVRTPANLLVPILPRRDEKGIMRLSGGTFWTTVTNIELKFAIDNGYDVLDCEDGMIWEQIIFPFTELINKCEALRIRYSKQALEVLAKLIQNGLYGKFGARRERWRVFVPKDENDTLNAVALDDDGYFWKREEIAESLRCLPIWAVWTTANARLHLLRQIYRVGVENVIYGDTDSITVKSGFAHLFPVSSAYGDWKLDKQWKHFRAIAPKLYAGELVSGEFKGAAKGLPKKVMEQNDWKRLLQGKEIKDKKFLSLESLMVAMQHDMRPAREAKRSSTNISNSRNWERHGNRIKPIFVTEK